jgi:hypothetical protein
MFTYKAEEVPVFACDMVALLANITIRNSYNFKEKTTKCLIILYKELCDTNLAFLKICKFYLQYFLDMVNM